MFLVGFAVTAVGHVLALMFMVNTAESTSLSRLVERHQQGKGLYGGVFHPYRAFKYETYRRLNPAVVVIGNSHALYFREQHFNASFYNLAAGTQTAADLSRIYRALLEEKRPKLVLFTVDYWNFTAPSDCRDTESFRPGSLDTVEFPREVFSAAVGIYAPFRLLYRGGLNLGELGRGIAGLYPSQQHGVPLVGATAVIKHRGIFPDGSTFDYETRPFEERFGQALLQIGRGSHESAAFEPCTSIVVTAIDALADAVRQIRAANVELITIAPPFAPSISQAMRQQPGAYAYIDVWRRRMAERVEGFVDFHDPAELGSSDCEFIDQTHGGEIAYIWLLVALAGRVPEVRPLINLEHLAGLIDRYPGHIVVPHDREAGDLSRFVTSHDPACPIPG